LYTFAAIIRKPSVYAGENDPTAVYDAALLRVCQSKNRYLFRFWRVYRGFVPISPVFHQNHVPLHTLVVDGANCAKRAKPKAVAPLRIFSITGNMLQFVD
jgi:hypothetical protein